MKVMVTVSAVAALLFSALVAERVLFACLVLGVAYIAGRIWSGKSRAAFVTITYVFPAIAFLTTGESNFWTDAAWKLALLGLLLGFVPLARWSMPPLWTVTLGTWAMTVALCWPVVLLRELDYSPGLFSQGEYSISTLVWIASVAATHLLGFLWIDSLFVTHGSSQSDTFDRDVLRPLLIGVAIAGGIAVWQMFVDVGFMNTRSFAFLRRASGGMRDANAYGTVAALWVCGALAIASRPKAQRGTRLLAAAAGIACVAGLWASGSRTALLAGMVGMFWAVTSARSSVGRVLRRPALLAAILAILVFSVLVAGNFLVIGPLARVIDWLPHDEANPVKAAIWELWNRNWYGTVAMAMIKDSPVVGVGVGSFHALAPPYADMLGHGPLPGDNAQNWFRHQFAEFGLLGSIGWIAWTTAFAILLVRDRRGGDPPFVSAAVKGALIGLGAASLLGMPTQDPAVLLTFWTFVFWFVRNSPVDIPIMAPDWTPRTARMLMAGSLLAVLCAGLTAYVGWTLYRPPLRALNLGFDYDYGFHGLELTPKGETVRWTTQRAVTVMSAPTRWIRMSFMVNHLDLTTKPVDVRLRRNTELIFRIRLRSAVPTVIYIQVPEHDKRVMLETWVSRVVRPSDYGMTDDRILGLLVNWDFVDKPEASGTTIEAPEEGRS